MKLDSNIFGNPLSILLTVWFYFSVLYECLFGPFFWGVAIYLFIFLYFPRDKMLETST